jgi:galactokinase
VDRRLAVAVRRAEKIMLVSAEREQRVESDPTRIAPTQTWADLPLGVLAELRANEVDVGVSIAVVSDIPAGTGLSSSAALGVATVLAVLELGGASMSAIDVARLCRRAEHRFLGVPSGPMDQVASLLGRRDHALLFDATAETTEPVAVPSSMAWLIIESGVRRSLKDTEYGKRTEEAAEALRLARQSRPGLVSLGDLDPVDIETLELPAPLNARARHIAGDTRRVRFAVACLEAGNIVALGQLLHSSHNSLARQYEVSTPELDNLVEAAIAAGCAGARMMGAGFGGSVLGLAPADQATAVAAALAGHGRVHRVSLVDGAAVNGAG